MQKNDLVHSISELTFPETGRLVRVPSALPRLAARRPLTWTLGRLRGSRPPFYERAEPRTDREAVSLFPDEIEPRQVLKF